MRTLRRRPFGARTLLAVGTLALVGAAVAAAGPLTATAPVRVPDNPLASASTCSALVAQQTAAGSINP